MITTVSYATRAVRLQAASAEEATTVGKGLAAAITRKIKANPNLVRENSPCRLKLSDARYIGSTQAAYSDDLYFSIPFEGTPDAVSAEIIGKLFFECRNGFSRNAEINHETKTVTVYEYHGIGD